MSDITKRLKFDANDVRNCHSSTIANRIEEAIALIERQAARIAELDSAQSSQQEPLAYFINDSAPGMKPHYSQIGEEFRHHRDVLALYTHPHATGSEQRRDALEEAEQVLLNRGLFGAAELIRALSQQAKT